jgi:hypothetical protein
MMSPALFKVTDDVGRKLPGVSGPDELQSDLQAGGTPLKNRPGSMEEHRRQERQSLYFRKNIKCNKVRICVNSWRKPSSAQDLICAHSLSIYLFLLAARRSPGLTV